MAKSRLLAGIYVVALILLFAYTSATGMENRGFVVGGYGLTWGVLLAYALRLGKRTETTARALEAFAETPAGAAGTERVVETV